MMDGWRMHGWMVGWIDTWMLDGLLAILRPFPHYCSHIRTAGG